MLDRFSRYVVGGMVSHRATARLAHDCIAATAAKQGSDPGTRPLQADRGTSLPAQPVACLLADWGSTPRPARPQGAGDNPASESQCKTRQDRPDCPDRCLSAALARALCGPFCHWYNTEQHHSGLGWHPPAARHYGLAEARPAIRCAALTAAYQAHPARFVRHPPPPPAIPPAAGINPPPSAPEEVAAMP